MAKVILVVWFDNYSGCIYAEGEVWHNQELPAWRGKKPGSDNGQEPVRTRQPCLGWQHCFVVYIFM
jgi:hypothetical protein